MSNGLNVPARTLMGPGPSDVFPSVLRSMSAPLVGHMDPFFLKTMNEIMEQLRILFGTKNQTTIPMSGTGSAGMETIFVNLLEPGDSIIIGVNGVFGGRMVDVAERCGADVIRIEAPWGEPIPADEVAAALKRHAGVKAVALVHAETSTGVRQPLKEIGQLARSHGALYLVDAVTSLGGVPVAVDKTGIDACYSGTQKCLSVPPGLAPVTLGERAMAAMAARKQPVQSWYLDLSLIASYWGQERVYHHTAPISLNFALHEGLRLILEEGLENVYERHERLGQELQAGLGRLGLELPVAPEFRLPQLTVVTIPAGVDDSAVRSRLLREYGIEIGGGLGAFKGRVWRIGLMGAACSKRNVSLLLAALGEIIGC